MLNSPFYHQLLRRYTIAFGQMFANLTLLRYDAQGDEHNRFVVPLEYSAREAWLTRVRTDPDLDRGNAIVVPRMAFEMAGLRYEPTRKTNTLNKRLTLGSLPDGMSGLRKYFVGTPYVLTFNLYAITRSIDDANQIMEQIVTHFSPDQSVLVRAIPCAGIVDRMRIGLDPGSPTWVDTYEEAGLVSTREIVLTFTFSAAVNLFGPISTTPSNIIRTVIVDMHSASYGAVLMDPAYLLTDSLDRLTQESNVGRLLTEDDPSELRESSRISRMVIVPNPLDAQPPKPVDSTTTTTNYIDGYTVNPITGQDQPTHE